MHLIHLILLLIVQLLCTFKREHRVTFLYLSFTKWNQVSILQAVRCVSVCKCVSELELTQVAYIYMYKDVGSDMVDRQSLSCSGSDGTIWGWNGSALVEEKANLAQMGKTPAGVHWSWNLFGHKLSEYVCKAHYLLCPTPPETQFFTVSFMPLPFAIYMSLNEQIFFVEYWD